MSDATAAQRQFGQGPLSRISAWVYSLLVIEMMVVLTTLPATVALLLLDRDSSNLALGVLCLLPVGPAVSAALYAMRAHTADLTDLKPASAFVRGYRLNVKGSLQIWVPWLALCAVAAVNLSNLDASGVPRWWAALLVVVTVGATLWMINALVITSLFSFRARDIARLAAYCLGRTRKVTVTNACLLIVMAGLVFVASELALIALASVFVLGLLFFDRPMIDVVREEFTA